MATVPSIPERINGAAVYVDGRSQPPRNRMPRRGSGRSGDSLTMTNAAPLICTQPSPFSNRTSLRGSPGTDPGPPLHGGSRTNTVRTAFIATLVDLAAITHSPRRRRSGRSP